jgi:hypothetical protein
MMEHRHVMEQAIGRALEEWEQVHHINHAKADNRIENLELVSKRTHNHHHQRFYRDEIVKECGGCREIKPRSQFLSNAGATEWTDPQGLRCRKCMAYRQVVQRLWKRLDTGRLQPQRRSVCVL